MFAGKNREFLLMYRQLVEQQRTRSESIACARSCAILKYKILIFLMF